MENTLTSSDLKFIDGYQRRWSPSDLEALKRCARYHQYITRQALRSKYPSASLIFGSALHHALEHYNTRLAQGGTKQDALHLAIICALNEGQPLKSLTDTRRTLLTLCRAITWYSEQFKEDPLQIAYLPNGSPALELPFKVPIPHLPGHHLSGIIDRVVSLHGSLYLIDTKTGANDVRKTSYWKRYSPHEQISAYCWAIREAFGINIKGFIIEGFQLAVGFCRIRRGIIPRTSEYLQEWLHDTTLAIQGAERYTQDDYWPMNDGACTVYGGCKLLDICAQSPSHRQASLDEDFAPSSDRPTAGD